MPKGRAEMGTKKSKKRSKKMTNGLQFRSLQFGPQHATSPVSTVANDDVLSKFTPGQREKLERFGKNAKSIISRAVALLRADVARMPLILSIKDEAEREELTEAVFLSRYGKSPRDYEESMFIQTTIKFAQTL